MMVGSITRHTTRSIAAHLCLTTICIEHTHADIRPVRGQNQHQAIGSDREMTVAETLSQQLRGGYRETHGIDIDIIVACTLHLCESDLHISLTFTFGSVLRCRAVPLRCE